MNTGQRIIKLFATVFAIFLAIAIICGIVGGVFFAFQITSGSNPVRLIEEFTNGANNGSDYDSNHDSGYDSDQNTNGYSSNSSTSETSDTDFDFSNVYTGIEILEVDASIHNVTICSGDEFRVSGTNMSTPCSVDVNKDTLKIGNPSFSGRTFSAWIEDLLKGNAPTLRTGNIMITIPPTVTLRTCTVSSGTGRLQLEDIHVKNLTLDAGVGNIWGSGVTADYLDLDSGTGTVEFNNVLFYNSDIDAGTGSVEIEGRMLGRNIMDCGVGTISLYLHDPKDSYSLHIEKGLGSILVDGSSYHSDLITRENTDNSMQITGGVGLIKIDFSEPF